MNVKKKVLFVCVHNSAPSQMAPQNTGNIDVTFRCHYIQYCESL